MIWEALIWSWVTVGRLVHDAVAVVVPDAWLTYLNTVLEGTGVGVFEVLVLWMTPAAASALVVVITQAIALFVLRSVMLAVRTVRSWTG